MKKRLMAALVAAFATISVSAQDNFTIRPSAVGDSSLTSYKEQRLEDLPYIQAYQVEDGTILKAADAIGWGIEAFAGYGLGTSYNTPEVGLSVRFDNKRMSYRLSGEVLSRQHNDESINPTKRYVAYAADAALHLNLYTDKKNFRQNFFSVYVTGGYMYDSHKVKVAEAEILEGTQVTYAAHKGSGVTYGGGFEYRRNFFATGNSLAVRLGYKNTTNAYINNTRSNGMFYAQVGFTFGIARNRVKYQAPK